LQTCGHSEASNWERRLGAARAREPALLPSRSQDGGAEEASSERRAGCPQRASGDGRGQPRAAGPPQIPIAYAIGLPDERASGEAGWAAPSSASRLKLSYAPAHEHLPLPDLLGRDPRDPRQTRLPTVRRDPRDLLRGRADGGPGRRRGRATLTIGATGNLSRRVSFRVRKDRSGEGSLPAAQTGPVTVSLRIGVA